MTARATIATMADGHDRRPFDVFEPSADIPPIPDGASGSPQRGQLVIGIGGFEADAGSISRQRGQREGRLGIGESLGEKP
jgi:hypothetical protein